MQTLFHLEFGLNFHAPSCTQNRVSRAVALLHQWGKGYFAKFCKWLLLNLIFFPFITHQSTNFLKKHSNLLKFGCFLFTIICSKYTKFK